jgi:hypothetical protein
MASESGGGLAVITSCRLDLQEMERLIELSTSSLLTSLARRQVGNLARRSLRPRRSLDPPTWDLKGPESVLKAPENS